MADDFGKAVACGGEEGGVCVEDVAVGVGDDDELFYEFDDLGEFYGFAAYVVAEVGDVAAGDEEAGLAVVCGGEAFAAPADEAARGVGGAENGFEDEGVLADGVEPGAFWGGLADFGGPEGEPVFAAEGGHVVSGEGSEEGVSILN